MKKMIISDSVAMMLDTETCETNIVENSREAIHRIYRVGEDCEMNVKIGDYTKKADVKANDIVIVFYENEFPNRVIVVNNDEWNENFDTYEKIMQARKEEWAKRNAQNLHDAQNLTDACVPEKRLA